MKDVVRKAWHVMFAMALVGIAITFVIAARLDDIWGTMLVMLLPYLAIAVLLELAYVRSAWYRSSRLALYPLSYSAFVPASMLLMGFYYGVQVRQPGEPDMFFALSGSAVLYAIPFLFFTSIGFLATYLIEQRAIKSDHGSGAR